MQAKAEGKEAPPNIVIKSESDAYEILRRATNNEIGEYGQIVFDGWPTLSLYFKGEKFDQSITPTVMHGLLEFQRGIYRSYATAKFNSPSRRLTEEEKKDFEIKVDVKSGSSNFEINFQQIAEKLVEQLGSRMSPTEVLYTVVAIAAMYFGTSAYRSFLQNRKEIREKEITDETQRATLEALTFTSAEETKRTQIIANLAKQDHRIEGIASLASEAHGGLVKTLSAGSQAKVGGIDVPPMVSEALSQHARKHADAVRLDGHYKLVKLDWTDPTRFKVRVYNIRTGLTLDAVVQDDSLTGKYKEALKTAEWSRRAVSLQINARFFGDEDYRDAVIIEAELVPEAPEAKE